MLPDDLQEKILRLLPTVDLLRGRAVCKQWLSLASHLLLSRPPWILLCSKSCAKQVEYSLAYDLEACEWYKLPATNLPESCVLEGCVQGLLVARAGGRGLKDSFCIGDPWTGTWKQLQVGFTFTRIRGFFSSEKGGSLAIIASHWVRFSQVTKVLWQQSEKDKTLHTVACNLPSFMVERDAKLYSWMRPCGLMVYDVGKAECALIHGTKDDQMEEDRRTKTLLKCGNRLVRVCVDEYDPNIFGNERYVRVEQLCEEGSLQEPIKWEEVGVIPTHLVDQLLDGWWMMGVESFAGGMNHVCFRAQRFFKILTFDLVHRTWNWLPDCPFLAKPFSKSQCRALKGCSLEVWPRLFPTIFQNLHSIS
ncbi:hypothetical protein GOP47_0015584 [Adiantum capillus-veneris]|uniref:F-box domain-containing protein n=1 Tax=Adiantum capillus-veneris TaxID=13818 RepID=A0A9D4UJX0_ADICA|nr:hypothetical protein GOP47_0015584 [Adiantum capillus-veneris]